MRLSMGGNHCQPRGPLSHVHISGEIVPPHRRAAAMGEARCGLLEVFLALPGRRRYYSAPFSCCAQTSSSLPSPLFLLSFAAFVLFSSSPVLSASFSLFCFLFSFSLPLVPHFLFSSLVVCFLLLLSPLLCSSLTPRYSPMLLSYLFSFSYPSSFSLLLFLLF